MPHSTSQKIWFITGASKGFGYIWTEAALERGDSVAAAARNTASLDGLKAKYGDRLLPLALDVGDKKAVDQAVAKARKTFDRIDVAVNNAGYGLFGAIEEISEAEAREQIETSLFGALWVTQAVLPIMRAQKSGHIIQISSIGGVLTLPTIGLYHASKWGLEGFSQALAAELKPLGIKVTIVEPGGFATEWGTTSAHRAKTMPAYDAARASLAGIRTQATPGDPAATGPVILKLADMKDPPLRIFFGNRGLTMIKQEYAERIATWEKWNALSLEAQGHLAAH